MARIKRYNGSSWMEVPLEASYADCAYSVYSSDADRVASLPSDMLADDELAIRSRTPRAVLFDPTSQSGSNVAFQRKNGTAVSHTYVTSATDSTAYIVDRDGNKVWLNDLRAGDLLISGDYRYHSLAVEGKSVSGSSTTLNARSLCKDAKNDSNVSAAPSMGLMGMYCYYASVASAYANIANSTKGVFIRLGTVTNTSKGSAVTVTFSKAMTMVNGSGNSITANSISVMLVDGSNMSQTAAYRSDYAVTAVSSTGFTYITSNNEAGTVRYLAIGITGD